MKFSTPQRLARFLYFGINTRAYPGDEAFGIALGRFYVGCYGPKVPGQDALPSGWCAGFLDEWGCL